MLRRAAISSASGAPAAAALLARVSLVLSDARKYPFSSATQSTPRSRPLAAAAATTVMAAVAAVAASPLTSSSSSDAIVPRKRGGENATPEGSSSSGGGDGSGAGVSLSRPPPPRRIVARAEAPSTNPWNGDGGGGSDEDGGEEKNPSGGFFDISEKWAKNARRDAADFFDGLFLKNEGEDDGLTAAEAGTGKGKGTGSGTTAPSAAEPPQMGAGAMESLFDRIKGIGSPPLAVATKRDGVASAEDADAEVDSFLGRVRVALDKELSKAAASSGGGEEAAKKEEDTPFAQDEEGGFSLLRTFSDLVTGGGTDERSVKALIEKAREADDAGGDVAAERRSLAEVWRVLGDVDRTLDSSFGHLDLTSLDPTAIFYFLEAEDERKNPSWKRRVHRYRQGVDVRRVEGLNVALELAHLSYADSVDEIRDQLGSRTTSDQWELVYCQTESYPGEPGHFLALKKGQSRWSKSLDVLMVVRGTKSVTDMLTDALMDPIDYRGGKAHDGILQSGRFLVDKHSELLRNLRRLSGKQKINLTIVGHSLGAAAASIAGIEFQDDPNVDVSVVGFGCPALLSRDLSESARDYITTVVGDADVIPRCSAATIANLALDVMEFDWTERGRRDVQESLDEMREWSPFVIGDTDVEYVMGLVDGIIDKSIKPAIKEKTTERMEPVLFPPGTCIHFYRDGSGISGSYVPCTFFGEIDLARTMVDDHLTKGGYGKIFLELMRQYHRDAHFAFEKEQEGKR